MADVTNAEPSSGPVADLTTSEPMASSLRVVSPSHIPSNNNSEKVTTSASLVGLAATSSRSLDAFLAHLNRCLSTPQGIDTVLLFVCYTSRLVSAVLGSLAQASVRRRTREWIALAAALPPRTTVWFSTDKTVAPMATARTLALAKRLAALSGLLSEARIMLRLWGLLGMYFWARGLARETVAAGRTSAQEDETQEDKGRRIGQNSGRLLGTAISWAQLSACVVFQGLENGAYLSGRGVLGWSPRRQTCAYKWSARFWAVYVGLELARLATAQKVGEEEEARDWTDRWRRQIARNLAWAPLTVHWSMEKGFVNELVIGLLGSVPGIIQMRELWRETAADANRAKTVT